jgi:hypothetical protein
VLPMDGSRTRITATFAATDPTRTVSCGRSG